MDGLMEKAMRAKAAARRLDEAGVVIDGRARYAAIEHILACIAGDLDVARRIREQAYDHMIARAEALDRDGGEAGAPADETPLGRQMRLLRAFETAADLDARARLIGELDAARRENGYPPCRCDGCARARARAEELAGAGGNAAAAPASDETVGAFIGRRMDEEASKVAAEASEKFGGTVSITACDPDECECECELDDEDGGELIVGDLSGEEWRRYYVPADFTHDGEERELARIESPLKLARREGGSTHRVLGADGVVRIVPAPAFVVIEYKPRDPDDPFAF